MCIFGYSWSPTFSTKQEWLAQNRGRQDNAQSIFTFTDKTSLSKWEYLRQQDLSFRVITAVELAVGSLPQGECLQALQQEVIRVAEDPSGASYGADVTDDDTFRQQGEVGAWSAAAEAPTGLNIDIRRGEAAEGLEGLEGALLAASAVGADSDLLELITETTDTDGCSAEAATFRRTWKGGSGGVERARDGRVMESGSRDESSLRLHCRSLPRGS